MCSFFISANVTWFGTEEPKAFWEFIKLACKKLPGNSIAKIESLSGLRSPLAKVMKIKIYAKHLDFTV